METNQEYEVRPCVLWAGWTKRGYGYRRPGPVGTPRRVHVMAWELANGPVPEGYELHHLCGERACYEVSHLVPLTPSEHKAAHYAHLTHCKKGHEYTPENTIIITNGNGKRRCRTCTNDSARQRWTAR